MARFKTIYEWDIETVDEYGDITDHNHRDRLREFDTDELSASLENVDTDGTRLVLVRDEWDEIDGLVDRTWAYVDADGLPEYFADSMGEERNLVPTRFRDELSNRLREIKVAS